MSDIKPAAWTSKKGLRYLARTGFISVGKTEDRERNMPLYGPEAADEITRLRQLLSEAEKREKEAKRIAVNAETFGYGHGLEAAALLLDKAADKQKSAWDEHIASGSGNAATSHEAIYRSLASQVRALQSEER